MSARGAETQIVAESSVLPEGQVTATVRRSAAVGTLWALLGAGLLAAVYARVALLNLTTQAIGGKHDGYQNIWNNYWVKTALLDQHTNIFYTNLIYYPEGTSLRFHTLNPFNGLWTLPLNLTIGYVPALNLLFWVSLTLVLFFNFLLFRWVVGSPLAAFAGAAVATYANFRVIGFLEAGQAQMVSGQWLPLYLLFMLCAVHGPAPLHLRTEQRTRAPGEGTAWVPFAALSVLVLLVMSLTDWQYVVYAVFATLLYFAVLVLRRGATWAERRSAFVRLACIGAAYALFAVPTMIWPMLEESLSSPWLSVAFQSSIHAIDLADLSGFGLYNPGYLTILVAVGGFINAWRRGAAAGSPSDRTFGLYAALVAVVFYVMTLGPTLLVGGTDTGIPMPYSLLQNLPLFSTGRDPGRFNIMAMIGVGVLVSYAFAWFAKRQWTGGTLAPAEGWAGRLSRARARLRPFAPVIVALFLVVALWGFFVQVGTVESEIAPPDWPPFYEQLGRDPEQYAILEMPLFSEAGLGGSHYMSYQLVHDKARFSGRLARDRKVTSPENFVRNSSLFNHLWLLGSDDDLRKRYYPATDFLRRTDYRAQGLAILNYYDVRYIVVYNDALRDLAGTWDEALFGDILTQILGPYVQPSYTDNIMRVYTVPQGPRAANPLTLDTGDGWYNAEQRPDGVTYRWANMVDDAQAELFTTNLWQEPVRARLSFTALAYSTTRTISVLLDGQEVASRTLKPEDGERLLSVDLTLTSGRHIIGLASPEAPTPVDDPHDSRRLSFSVYGVSIDRAP